MKKSLKLGAACLGVAHFYCVHAAKEVPIVQTLLQAVRQNQQRSLHRNLPQRPKQRLKIRTLMRMIMMLNPWSSSVITRD